MSGRLRPQTPWARAGADAETRAAVEALLPDGTDIGVSVTSDHRRWILWLIVDGTVEPTVKVSCNISLRAACEWLVARRVAA